MVTTRLWLKARCGDLPSTHHYLEGSGLEVGSAAKKTAERFAGNSKPWAAKFETATALMLRCALPRLCVRNSLDCVDDGEGLVTVALKVGFLLLTGYVELVYDLDLA